MPRRLRHQGLMGLRAQPWCAPPINSNCSRPRATPTSASKPSTTAPMRSTSAGRRSARAQRRQRRSPTSRGWCEHAHRFNARVFVTLNTILRDDELEPARRLIWQLYDAGVDALIIQDMGLLELDLPPIQLHASTQTDIRTPEKARFLQDVGLSQIVLARELTCRRSPPSVPPRGPRRPGVLHPRRAVRRLQRPVLHQPRPHRAQRQPRRLLQACRLPYQVTDMPGPHRRARQARAVMKDNNQSDNLRALIDAGIRSFKIEGRYKDMGYVKNITAHYRSCSTTSSSAARNWRAPPAALHLHLHARPEPELQPRIHRLLRAGPQADIGAFDTPEEPRPAHRLRQQGRRRWVELRDRLARHRAEQRRRPVLLRPAEGTGRPRDQPRRKGARACGACSRKTRWRASRTCAPARWSTATAT
jgi:hypothetical protein